MIRRVGYVLREFPVVSQTFVASEVIELRRRGVDVRVLALRPPFDRPHRFVGRAGLGSITELGSRFEGFEPELYHAHFATEASAAARELAAGAGVPFTFTAHGYDIHDRPPDDLASRGEAAAAVVTVSQANADALVARGVPPSRLRVIPNGVDLARFSEPDPEPGLIVCVARYEKPKNLGLLLEALALLRDRGNVFRCVMVGDGKLRAELEQRHAELGLEPVVELAGAADHDDVLRWWARASIGVLSSITEGFPVCLLEAGASGVPVVGTAVGGVPELVVDGETGLLVPPGDPDALAAALERLLEDPAQARRLGAAARARVEERFTVARQVDDLLGVWAAI